MSRAVYLKIGGSTMSISFAIATAILPSVLPPSWVWPVITICVLGILGGGIVVIFGIKTQKKEDAELHSKLLAEIKDELISINKCEREIAISKGKQKYTVDNTAKLRKDFMEYIQGYIPKLTDGLSDMSRKQRVLDILLSFFTGISDVLDVDGFGLKKDLVSLSKYTKIEHEIATKQQKLNKKKRALIQKNIHNVRLLTYGQNSSILFRYIYHAMPTAKLMPVQYSLMLEGIERESEQMLTEMLNNLDIEWENILKIDTDKINWGINI